LQRDAGTDRRCYEWEAARLVGFAIHGKPVCGVFVVRSPSGLRNPRAFGAAGGRSPLRPLARPIPARL